MAETGNTELSLSPSKALSPSDAINGSHSPQAPAVNDQIHQESSFPAAQPSEDVVSGEKRKREDSDSGVSDPSLNPLWKTSLCSYFRRHDGSCSHGSECRYAHGEEELRPRPDNTWDPTSERAKKAMKSETGEKCAVSMGVMMTEAVVDDADGEDNDDSNHALSKCLVHLPRKWGSDNLRGFLNQEGIPFKSAKKKKGMLVGFVTFEDQEQLKSSTKELEGKLIGSKSLKVADVIPRSFEKKSNVTLCAESAQNAEAALAKENTDENVETNGANLVVGDSVPKTRSLRDVVTPLAHMAYADQLEHKKGSLTQILKRLTRNARKACPSGVSLPEWILKSRDIGSTYIFGILNQMPRKTVWFWCLRLYEGLILKLSNTVVSYDCPLPFPPKTSKGGLPCKLEGIIGSPRVNGYRNKCEFSVGYSVEGKVTVGFMLGNFREGVTAVEEAGDCPNVSTIALQYASIFQEFLQQSQLPVWNRFKNSGFWRQLTVREGRTNGKVADAEDFGGIAEVMLIVQVSTKGFDNELVTGEFEKLAQAFVAGAIACSPSLPLTALVVQDHQGISNVAPADAPLRSLLTPKAVGDQISENDAMDVRIHDYISNLKFSISPTAFFQVNTLAAEKLYSLAGDWACLGPDTLLFDICCGTGTIGLTLAHRVGMVIGVEMNASAVSDAQRNAEINGIKNCRFICAKAEDVMGSLLKEHLNKPKEQVSVRSVCGTDAEEISEGSTCPETENGEQESQCSENGRQEDEIEAQRGSNCENGNSLLQQFKNAVAIVDPPRAGLHPTVIKALRTNQGLRRLVYISCNPESLVANAIELCTPSPAKMEKGNKDNRGWRNMSSAGLARHRAKSMPISEAFQPIKAMAVDLFPHTEHCELVMLLER